MATLPTESSQVNNDHSVLPTSKDIKQDVIASDVPTPADDSTALEYIHSLSDARSRGEPTVNSWQPMEDSNGLPDAHAKGEPTPILTKSEKSTEYKGLTYSSSARDGENSARSPEAEIPQATIFQQQDSQQQDFQHCLMLLVGLFGILACFSIFLLSMVAIASLLCISSTNMTSVVNDQAKTVTINFRMKTMTMTAASSVQFGEEDINEIYWKFNSMKDENMTNSDDSKEQRRNQMGKGYNLRLEESNAFDNQLMVGNCTKYAKAHSKAELNTKIKTSKFFKEDPSIKRVERKNDPLITDKVFVLNGNHTAGLKGFMPIKCDQCIHLQTTDGRVISVCMSNCSHNKQSSATE